MRIYLPLLLVVLVVLGLCPLAASQTDDVWLRVQSPGFLDAPRNREFSPTGLHFFDSKSGVIVGSYRASRTSDCIAAIAITFDGGTNWKVRYFGKTVIEGISFSSNGVGWAVGSTAEGEAAPATPFILKSSDRGATWERVKNPVSRADAFGESVFFLDRDLGFLFGAHSAGESDRSLLLRTTDGGKTWIEVFYGKDSRSGLHYGSKLSFSKRGKFGIAIGDGGEKVLFTRDLGRSWTVSRTGYSQEVHPFLNAEIVSESEAWLTTDSDQLIHTSDGGSTWNLIEIVASSSETESLMSKARLSFRGLAFENTNRGWISGNSGLILATSNGGKSWNAESYGESGYIRSMQIVGDTVFALGDGPVLLVRKL
jgi:photosystem II stability/assembly factor-like uncharacterized protein